ncbi:MAG: hypothetical protein OEW75_02680 [Cyclobacteriaceae bacterium]|nr:hypothetical protein [Cyclobacteriaceae bacterium]
MELEEINKYLNDFSDKYDLINEAIKSCKIAMNNCFKDDKEGLGGFSIDEIILLFDHQEVVFKHSFRSTPIVKTQIGLYKKEKDEVYLEGHEPIGYYILDCDSSGETFDDWLIISEEKNNQMDFIYPLQKMNQSLPMEYLRRNSPNYEYVSYVNHVISFYQAKQYESCQWFIKRAFEFIDKNTIPEKGTEYFKKSRKFMIQLIDYMDECGLLNEELKPKLEKLGVLKTNG